MERVFDFSNKQENQEVVSATLEQSVESEPIIAENNTSSEEPIIPQAEVVESVVDTPIPPKETVFNFDEEFVKKTNGKFKSVDEVLTLSEQFEQKLKELETTPKFANDYVEKLNDYISKGGDAETFVKFQKLNVEEMDDLEVAMEYYKTVEGITNQEELESYLFSKYKQGVDPEEFGLADWEVKSGKVHLTQDAKQFRQKISELKAKNLEIQPKQNGLSQEEMQLLEAKNSLIKEMQDAFNSYKGYSIVTDDPEAKVSVEIALDDNSKQNISNVLKDPENNIWSLFATKDNQFDKAKFFKVLQYAQDTEKYDKMVASNSFMQGVNSVIANTKNASINSNTIQSQVEKEEVTYKDMQDSLISQLSRLKY